MDKKTVRRFLPLTKDFKAFWKRHGPFKYALTSAEFPPILLEPEEWIFSDNIVWLLKELLQWVPRDMSIVEAPFNKDRKSVIKPDLLIPWKVNNFPQEWEGAVCDTFTPVGYLTEAVNRIIKDSVSDNMNAAKSIESAFFYSLALDINKIGYVLLKPEPLICSEAYIDSYLKEWQEDEDES